MNKRPLALLAVAVVLSWAAPAFADYTLVLKNGRRITVQSYREEGSTIKIQGLGGEIGIPRDQIQTILKGDQTEPGVSTFDLESASRQSQGTPKPSPAAPGEGAEARATGQAKPSAISDEEKEYRKRLAEVSEKLDTARQKYFNATQGGGTSKAATKEGYKALTADLMARLKERRGAAESEFEPQEKELRDLRLEIDKLQQEREALIQEMKSKNYPTGNN